MTEKTTRPTTTAGELTAGQHILPTIVNRPHRVEHTYRTETGQVLLYLVPLDGVGEPLSRIWNPSMAVPLVTDDELAAMKATAHRAAVVAALRALADDIEDLALPVPRYGLNVSAAVWTYAEAEAWAEYLGVEVRAGGTQKDIPVVDREGDALAVHVQSQEPMPDAIPLDVAAGADRAEAVQAEADALGVVDPEPTQVALTVPKHYHQGGSTGGPGGSSAGCGCGATFSGFASHAEAMAALNEHIAAMDAQAGE